MSVNLFKPHLVILPEDEKNRDIALAVQRHLPRAFANQIKIENPLRGWLKTLDAIDLVYQPNKDEQYIVAVIDFDDNLEERHQMIAKRFEENGYNKGHVFVIGAKSEAENVWQMPILQDKTLRLENEDYLKFTDRFWTSDQLVHNRATLEALCQMVHKVFHV